ncbi:MAG TPA: glycine dehydrogenase (aminomethyl-transferring), partial [Gammaproteobacteria bacterium]|nr:glycine dehydrogenase (aminomethyl-transferring) [Gammaproteobacteria bacterium]
MNAVTGLPMSSRTALDELEQHDAFSGRHIGPDAAEQQSMLKELGFATRAALMEAIVPAGIRRQGVLPLGSFTAPATEHEALNRLRKLADKNQVLKSFIGQGYYGSYTPGVILRTVFENPAWYTAYTPYQPEISQGRLEALLNYQQMVTDLT